MPKFVADKQSKNTMKKINALLLALLIAATVACKKKEDETTDPVTEAGVIELSGDLSTQTLDASKKYLLKSTVYVRSGQILTIPAGTVIMGDKGTKGTLVVSPGGKIYANGTASSPVVFTAEGAVGERDRGDWGGLLILGNAQVNHATNNEDGRPYVEGISPNAYYGNTSTDYNTESSGTLQYVRIEFAGIALFPNQETNSLTLAGVGSGTVIDHVQVSYGGDDGFEFFGGTVNATHLVAYANLDDDLDCDNGYSGKVQHVLVVRDHAAADQSGSNGFEVDNNATGTTATPLTSAQFSNVTIFGPRSDSASSGTAAINANYGRAMHLRRSSNLTIINSVFMGYSTGFYIDGANTQATFKNNVVALTKSGTTAPATYGKTADATYPTDLLTDNVFDTISTATTKVAEWTPYGIAESLFFRETQPYSANPNFAVTSGIIATGASFTGFTFPESPAYRGAFGATDWTDTWTTFDPINTAY